MRLILPLVLALLAPLVGAQGLQIHAAVALDVAGDTEGMTRRPVATAPNRFVWVGEVVLDLPPSSIQTVGLETDDAGATALSLWLSEDAARAFAELTERSVGKALAVVYQQRVLIAPIVVSPIPNGLVMITGMEESEAQALADALRQATTPAVPESTVLEPAVPEPVASEPAAPVTRASIPLVPTRDASPISPSPPTEPERQRPPLGDETNSEAAQAGQAFVNAVAARDWRAVATLLHPDARRVARASALSILRLDGGTVTVRSDGREGSFIAADVLGVAPFGRVEDLAEQDVAALYLAALDVLGIWGPPGSPRRVVGQVRDGDHVHVILRASADESGVSDITVVTLALDLGAWRPLLTQPQGF